jgi:hypothetical protein
MFKDGNSRLLQRNHEPSYSDKDMSTPRAPACKAADSRGARPFPAAATLLYSGSARLPGVSASVRNTANRAPPTHRSQQRRPDTVRPADSPSKQQEDAG